jgi:hypothetical protein
MRNRPYAPLEWLVQRDDVVEDIAAAASDPALGNAVLPRAVAKSQVLQQQASAGAEDAKECSEPEPEQVDHDGKVIADRILVLAPMLLISKPDGIVASDTRPVVLCPGLWSVMSSGWSSRCAGKCLPARGRL